MSGYNYFDSNEDAMLRLKPLKFPYVKFDEKLRDLPHELVYKMRIPQSFFAPGFNFIESLLFALLVYLKRVGNSTPTIFISDVSAIEEKKIAILVADINSLAEHKYRITARKILQYIQDKLGNLKFNFNRYSAKSDFIFFSALLVDINRFKRADLFLEFKPEQTVVLSISEDNSNFSLYVRGFSQFDPLGKQVFRNIAKHITNILSKIAKNMETPIVELPLYDEYEESEVIKNYNENSEIKLSVTSVMELIRKSAEIREDFVAVEDGNVCITYSELWKRSGLVAIELRKRRVGLESRVCIYMDKSVEMIISILGVLRSGGAYVPVDIGYPKKRVEYILKHSGCSVLITKGRSEEFNNFSGDAIDVDYLFDSVKGEESDLGHIFFCEGISEENLAYIMYTSGSSGLPKGVMGLHRNLDSSIMSRMVEYDVKNEKSLFIVSGAFDSSITAIFWPLAEGGCLNIEAGRVGVNELEERIWKEKVTHLATPVGLYLELLREGRHERLKNLRLVIVAGEQCPDELSDLHYEKMKNTYLSNEYGPTEASVCSSFDIIKENGKSRCIFKHSRLDVRVYILDRYLKVLPVGHVGEIYLSGLCLTRGIIGKPAETAKIYLSNPYFNHEKDEPYYKFIYQTSGIGRYLLDGKIEFLGYNHKIFENLVT